MVLPQLVFRIYKITNLINGKIYIGQTVKTMSARISNYKAGAKIKVNQVISRAINKYGFENFKFEQLYTVDSRNEANYLEKYLIAFYNTTDKRIGYNVALGGVSGTGVVSPETKSKISKGNTGKIRTQEQRDNHSKIMKGRLSEENKNRSVRVLCSNGEIYPSMAEAARQLNLHPTQVSWNIRGIRKRAGKFTFSLFNDSVASANTGIAPISL